MGFFKKVRQETGKAYQAAKQGYGYAEKGYKEVKSAYTKPSTQKKLSNIVMASNHISSSFLSNNSLYKRRKGQGPFGL